MTFLAVLRSFLASLRSSASMPMGGPAEMLESILPDLRRPVSTLLLGGSMENLENLSTATDGLGNRLATLSTRLGGIRVPKSFQSVVVSEDLLSPWNNSHMVSSSSEK